MAGGGDARDGAVAKHVLKKRELWRRQAQALDAPAYRLTLIPRREGLSPINLGKPSPSSKKGDRERFWTAAEVAKKIPLLSAKNAQGYDIYITPIDDRHHYLVLDDSTLDAIEELKRAGARPALIQETSPGNVQAVFKVPRNPSFKWEQQAANRVVQVLNKRYGDPRFSGVVHPFRMSGFSSKKSGRGNFFTRIIDAQGGDCPLLTRRLEIERRRADEAVCQAAQDRVQLSPPGEAGKTVLSGDLDVWRVERRRQRRLAERLVAAGKWATVDESAVDFRVARELLKRGLDGDEVRRLMASDPDIQERHGRALDDYCLRTVLKAAADIERQAQRRRRRYRGPMM